MTRCTRKRAFDAEIIELCVRWYITYRLSYRDLVEMMAERGVKVGPFHHPSVGDLLLAGSRPVSRVRADKREPQF